MKTKKRKGRKWIQIKTSRQINTFARERERECNQIMGKSQCSSFLATHSFVSCWPNWFRWPICLISFSSLSFYLFILDATIIFFFSFFLNARCIVRFAIVASAEQSTEPITPLRIEWIAKNSRENWWFYLHDRGRDCARSRSGHSPSCQWQRAVPHGRPLWMSKRKSSDGPEGKGEKIIKNKAFRFSGQSVCSCATGRYTNIYETFHAPLIFLSFGRIPPLNCTVIISKTTAAGIEFNKESSARIKGNVYYTPDLSELPGIFSSAHSTRPKEEEKTNKISQRVRIDFPEIALYCDILFNSSQRNKGWNWPGNKSNQTTNIVKTKSRRRANN